MQLDDTSRQALKGGAYWKGYVVETDAEEIERCVRPMTLTSGATTLELLHFAKDDEAPNILISPGSGGHAYVFAELGYQIHLRGYRVFVMPKHGDATINELVERHHDVARFIGSRFGDRIGIFGEGLGGYAAFYLGLAHGPVTSMICQNAPAILTEDRFHEAIVQGAGIANRRKIMLHLGQVLVDICPRLKIPIRLYLDFAELIDPVEPNRRVEAPQVARYLADPEFDRSYSLSAIMSLVSTPPPNPLTELRIPTMFLVPTKGLFVPYVKDLYGRLPAITKKLVEVDGSVFWMCSHPKQAADIICQWFQETL